MYEGKIKQQDWNSTDNDKDSPKGRKRGEYFPSFP